MTVWVDNTVAFYRNFRKHRTPPVCGRITPYGLTDFYFAPVGREQYRPDTAWLYRCDEPGWYYALCQTDVPTSDTAAPRV